MLPLWLYDGSSHITDWHQTSYYQFGTSLRALRAVLGCITKGVGHFHNFIEVITCNHVSPLLEAQLHFREVGGQKGALGYGYVPRVNRISIYSP